MGVKLLRSGKTLRLRSKLYFSFGTLLMLGILVTVLVLAMMERSSSAYERVLETDRRVAEMAHAIGGNHLRMSESLRGRLLHPYGEFGEQELNNLVNAFVELDLQYQEVRRRATDPQLLATLGEIEKIDQQKLQKFRKAILDAINKDEAAMAEQLYFDEYLPARVEQERLLNRLNQVAGERITLAVQATQAQARLTRAAAVGLTVLLIIAGGLLSYYLTRSFELPINRLMRTARAIAAGDLNQQLTLSRRDELGEMAEVLNQMVSHLRRLNTDLADQVRWLRETKDELSRTQGQLVRQEKLAALGQLVAGVAHELNNPISFVYSNAVMVRDSIADLRKVLDYYDLHEGMPVEIKAGAASLKEELGYDYLVQDIPQTLEDCHEGARRVRDIVMSLKAFSRLDGAERQTADLAEGIESTIRLLGHFFRPDRVVLHRDYEEMPRIDCYPGQLSQVWMNLLANAAQAMKSRGELWVTTRVEGDRVVVRFRDNGPGIPEEIVGKIFDPFFTTKAVGEGTGLGLSIVHGIVERHGGEIRVESEVGAGATFIVELPLTTTQPAEVPAEPLAGAAA